MGLRRETPSPNDLSQLRNMLGRTSGGPLPGEKFLRATTLTLLDAYDDAMEANAILENICEHMATDHIVFQVLGNDEKVHPDWCVQCVLDRLRNAIAGRQAMIHEYLHGTDQYAIPDWRDCTQVICISAKQLAATKMPFAEDEKRTEPYTDKLRERLKEASIYWEHEFDDRGGGAHPGPWEECERRQCKADRDLIEGI